MKKLSIAIGIAYMAIISPQIYGQKGPKVPFNAGDRPCKEMMMASPLTEQQQAQMKELRIAHLKEVQPVQNEIRELKAHYKTLITAANPNMAEINKNIDSQSAAMNKLMKSRTSHQQEIRKILTDEQKLMRDMNPEKGRARGQLGKPGPGMGLGNTPCRPGVFCPCMN